MADTDADVSELAHEVIQELDPGTIIDDRVILSRRQLVGLATGTLSIGALTGFGAESASAQAAGQVGTESAPVDVEANLINGGGPIVDGDGIAREQYLIANGAGDPADADADDLIYEEEA